MLWNTLIIEKNSIRLKRQKIHLANYHSDPICNYSALHQEAIRFGNLEIEIKVGEKQKLVRMLRLMKLLTFRMKVAVILGA